MKLSDSKEPSITNRVSWIKWYKEKNNSTLMEAMNAWKEEMDKLTY